MLRNNRVFSENQIVIAGLVWAAVIFACWYPLQYVLLQPAYFGSVVDVGSNIKSTYSWMPLIKAVIGGNLFPTQPTINPSATGFVFYPYLTLWIYSAVIYLGGHTLAGFVFQFIFPLASFYLMIQLFMRYLSPLWALSISFLSVISFAGVPFRQFLIEMLQGKSWVSASSVQIPEIMMSPFPSISVFAFLLLFYVSTSMVRLSMKRVMSLTLLWGLFVQIHALDALFGVVFWLSYSFVRLYRQKVTIPELFSIVLRQLGIIAICLAPSLYLFYQSSIVGGESNVSISAYYYAVYFALPVFSLIVIYFINRIDIYEILFKFWHVYMLMLIELVFVLLVSHQWLPVAAAVVQNRIAFFFLHFYYYVPVVYFASRPAMEYSFGRESSQFAMTIRHLMQLIFGKLSQTYLLVFIMLLSVFALGSAYKNFQFQRDVALPSRQQVYLEIEGLDTKYKIGDVVISGHPVNDLLITILSNAPYSSLLANRFSNAMTVDDSIDRLALYAKMNKWPLDQFIRFMSPGALQANQSEIISLKDNDMATSGMGYWLVNHERQLRGADLDNYRQQLREHYQTLNLSEAKKRFHVFEPDVNDNNRE